MLETPHACVATETSSSWQQADYELLSARGTYDQI